MKRLTKRDICVSGKEKTCCTHFDSLTCWKFTGHCSDGCPYEEQAWDRLAAYEDTGLEPEKIEKILERGTPLEGGTAELMKEYLSLGSIDHLRELVQAEQDGRLVVHRKSWWATMDRQTPSRG